MNSGDVNALRLWLVIGLMAAMVLPFGAVIQHSSIGESLTTPVIDASSRSWTLTHSWTRSMSFDAAGVKLGNVDSNPGNEIIVAGGHLVAIYGGNVSQWDLISTVDIGAQYNISTFDLGDFDGDGDADMVVAANPVPGSNDNPLYIMMLENDGNANFVVHNNTHRIPSVWYGGLADMVTADVDHQLGTDIIISVSIDSRNLIGQGYKENPDKVSVFVLFNSGDGENFTRSEVKSYVTDYASGYIFGRLHYENLNGDNYDDLVVGVSGYNAVNPPNMPRYFSIVEAFMNNGGSILSQSSWNYTFGGPIIYGIDVENMDGDLYNRPDLLVGTDRDAEGDNAWNDGFLWVFTGNGDCTFSNTVSFSYENIGLGGIRNIVAGDMDNKPGKDAFITFWYGANSDEYSAILLSNDGSGQLSVGWTDSTNNNLLGDLIYVVGADLNLDQAGLIDIVYAGRDSVHALLNTYVDDEAPPAVTGVVVYDTPGDNGGSLTVEWNKYTISDFKQFNIYISDSYFNDVDGMTPESSITDMSKTKTTVSTIGGQPLENGKEYYIAVTPVDTNNNENKVVVPGHAAPTDDLPPGQLYSVTAVDTPNDNGGSITVEWQASNAPDFDHYNVYIKYKTPITSLVGMNPETTVTDKSTTSVAVTTVNHNRLLNGEDYYVAVTAVDTSGNEDRDNFATAGPVQPLDNLPPEAVTVRDFYDKPDDTGGVLVLEWEPYTGDDDFMEYRIYLATKSFKSVEDSGVSLIASISDRYEDTYEITTFNNDPLVDGTTYYCAITAVDTSENEMKTGIDVVSAVPRDNIPPDRVEGVTVSDKPGDDTGKVIVSWDPILDPGFDHYNVYVSPIKLHEIFNKTPEAKVYGRENTSVEIGTVAGIPMENGKTYFFIVTAVDMDGNELREGLNPVEGGPVDDVPPPKITGLKAVDNPDDTGKKILVSWSKSTDDNFDHYNIYVSVSKITDLDGAGVKLVKSIDDVSTTTYIVNNYGTGSPLVNGRDYYIAVTAVDKGGYENRLDFATVGPVKPLNNIPPKIDYFEPSGATVKGTTGDKITFIVTVQPNSDVKPKYTWYLDGKQVPAQTTNSYTLYVTDAMAGKTHNVTVVVDTENDLETAQSWSVVVEEQTIFQKATENNNGLMYAAIIVIIILIIAALVFAWKKGFIKLPEREREEHVEAEEVKVDEGTKKKAGGSAAAVRKTNPLLPGGKGGSYPALMPGQKPSSRSALPPPRYQQQQYRSASTGKRALPPSGATTGSGGASASQQSGRYPGGYMSVKNFLPPVTGEMPDQVGLRSAVKRSGGEKVTPPRCPVCGRPTKGNERRCSFCGEKFW